MEVPTNLLDISQAELTRLQIPPNNLTSGEFSDPKIKPCTKH